MPAGRPQVLARPIAMPTPHALRAGPRNVYCFALTIARRTRQVDPQKPGQHPQKQTRLRHQGGQRQP
jgi:hypothetical protein